MCKYLHIYIEKYIHIYIEKCKYLHIYIVFIYINDANNAAVDRLTMHNMFNILIQCRIFSEQQTFIYYLDMTQFESSVIKTRQKFDNLI